MAEVLLLLKFLSEAKKSTTSSQRRCSPENLPKVGRREMSMPGALAPLCIYARLVPTRTG